MKRESNVPNGTSVENARFPPVAGLRVAFTPGPRFALVSENAPDLVPQSDNLYGPIVRKTPVAEGETRAKDLSM